MSTARKLLLVSVAGALAACHAGDGLAPGPELAMPLPLAALVPGNGTPGIEEVELCKRGSSGSFSFTIDRRATGVGIDSAGTVDLADGECVRITQADGIGAEIVVTETGSQAGYVLDHVDVTHTTATFANQCQDKTGTTTTVSGPTVVGTASGSAVDNECDGTFMVFYNVPAPPPPFIDGRMTGGGNQIVIGDVRITRGFTIHCDITLSNNIEINWPGGNKWHLDKPISTALCEDDPSISPLPPAAPFDTFHGTAVGRLNGVDGARLSFTFVDAGEPGGGVDRARIQIWDVNNNLVLNVPLQDLTRGNVQAHYDQPHK